MKTIICLYCNESISNVHSDLNYFYCEKCKGQYYPNKNNDINTFAVKIGDFFLYYRMENENDCEIYHKYDHILSLPINVLLLPIQELKDKINNLMAFI
jgi:hypothetical protein